MKAVLECVIFILVFAGLLGMSFAVTAVLVWAVCWCFEIEFSWKIAAGVWIVILALKRILEEDN